MHKKNPQTSIVKADSTWSTETIPLPIDWLPKLTLKGFEELMKPNHWAREFLAPKLILNAFEMTDSDASNIKRKLTFFITYTNVNIY